MPHAEIVHPVVYTGNLAELDRIQHERREAVAREPRAVVLIRELSPGGMRRVTSHVHDGGRFRAPARGR